MTARRVIDSRYEVESLLGQGRTASVWLARDRCLDRSVAIKELTGRWWLQEPATLERFDRQARTVGSLGHPNIVAVHDVDIHNVIPYLVMELIEGVTVAQMLRNGVLTVGQAVAIAIQTCDGLSAAHALGFIHGDVKPANLMLTPAGVVKICDFGTAWALSRTGETGLTGPEFVVGTTRYMAPEQVRGEPVDARADLYGLGCTLHTMLIGVPPLFGLRAEVLWQHLGEEPAGLREHRADVPTPLEGLVAQLLAKAAADRPYDAAEVKARLADLVNDVPTSAPAVPLALPPSRGGPVPLMSGPVRGQARVVPSRVYGPRHASGARTRRTWQISVAGLILLAAVAMWMFVAVFNAG